jgi:purine-binding chemotaxis protein CheW
MTPAVAPGTLDGEPAPTVDAAGVRACLFLLDGRPFAIEVRHAREVVIVQDYTIVPRGLPHLVGVTNLRGYVLPVFDVRPLMGLPEPAARRPMTVVVVEADAARVAFVIERVLGLESFDEVAPLGDAARRDLGELGAGLLRRGDGTVTLLDPGRLLAALRRGGKGE